MVEIHQEDILKSSSGGGGSNLVIGGCEPKY